MAMSLYTVKHCERCGKMFRQYTYEKPGEALLCPYCWALRESKNAEEWQRHYMGKWNCGTMPEPKTEWPKYNPHVKSYLKIKNVIFNNPATIILWSDNTKTVVKCQPGDTYDKEKGFVMAYLKRLLGNDNTFNKEIHKWVKSDEEEGIAIGIPDFKSEFFEANKAIIKATQEDNLKDVLDEVGVGISKGLEDGSKNVDPDIVEAVAKTVEEAISKGAPEIKPGDDGYSDIHPVEDDGK